MDPNNPTPDFIIQPSFPPSHYGAPGPPGSQLQSKSTPSQSYVMASGAIQSGPVGGHDSGDEVSINPVSINVSNNPTGAMGASHDSGPPSDSHSSGQTEQRLKVEDALNYLDQVKYKFGNQPQVYNDFLDIMKDFKSQSIDTPGVIARVSNLFRGHPELIVGFNTFLPPGYKIEVQTHDQGSQISYRVDGVTSYVVTNIPPCLPSTVPPAHPPIQQPPSNPQIIQHTTAPGVPLRSLVTHTSHQGGTQSSYGSSSSVSGNVGNVGSVGITNGRSVSPPIPSGNLSLSGSNFDAVGPSSSFTHSFSSPFVQSAFPSLQSQPVEFNHAINYVNKIKNRFCGQPDKYKQFLEILHTYQKEQRNIKEGQPPSSKHLTEHEVYSQVAKLFENQEDLLQEFGQFLPDATNHAGVFYPPEMQDVKPIVEPPKKTSKAPPREYNPPVPPPAPTRPSHPQAAPKRTTTTPSHPMSKKPKLSAPYKDVTFAEASRYGTLLDYSFFDKVRSVLNNQDVYDNFLRCILCFNEEIISRQELLSLVQPFFSKAPELYAWLKEFVSFGRDDGSSMYEPVAQHTLKQEMTPEEQTLEIGEEYFSTCKRLGASYCALPKNHIPLTSSGRSGLCKEVLNDVWVSFPTWSEDSTFVTSRKTQYEEYICRCEDERFELDVIIEANADTIRTFECIARRMARMTPDELARFELDDTLGGTSTSIHQRTVKRVYGDKALEIIEGLKRQPFVVIPIVMKRLKLKEEEWRESQKNFNKIWREQVERFYLKSLDHQGITFKQSDIRMLRSKALVNEIETIYDERHDQENAEPDQPPPEGPHLALQYADRSVLDDACNLLLHHVRRQSGIQNEDKRKIKQLLKHFIPDLFKHTRMELSDEENEECSNEDNDDRKSPSNEYLQNGTRNGNKRGSTKRGNAKIKKEDEEDKNHEYNANTPNRGESRRTIAKRELKRSQQDGNRIRRVSGSAIFGKDNRASGSDGNESRTSGKSFADTKVDSDDFIPARIIQVPHDDQDESYTLFYTNNAWYVFLRLHHILCERLGRMLDTAAKMLLEETRASADPKLPPAVALRMKQTNGVELQDYYPTFLDMVKNLLDGNMEPNAYEDTMRELFGIHAYISYTMDKVVANAVRQLQVLVADESCLKFTGLFQQAQSKGGAGGLCDTAEQRLSTEIGYQKQAEKLDPEDNCYKTIFYHKSCRMTMELLEGATIEETNDLSKWNAYLDNYNRDAPFGIENKVKELMMPTFLQRNVTQWQQLHGNKTYHPDIVRITGLGPEHEAFVVERLPKRQKPDGTSKFLLNNTQLTPVTPEEAEELEKALERNSKRRSETGQKDQVENVTEVKISLKNNLPTLNPVTPEEAERLEKQLEMNAKRRAEASAPSKSPYVIKENLQCKFNPNSYKLAYVNSSENYFYLKGALKRAKETHKVVSTRMNEEFGKWHQMWMENNVTEDQITRCEDWLMSTKNSETKIISSNDIKLAPYRPFNRYVVKK